MAGSSVAAMREDIFAEEAFMIRHSGEIPEVAMHSAIHYLTDDPDGPGLEPSTPELALLKAAVLDRYRIIILRDLDLENRGRGLYRGLARSLVNWHRLVKFCRREGLGFEEVRQQAGAAFVHFIVGELAGVATGERNSCVNCSESQIREFAAELGLDPARLPDGWKDLCIS